VIGALLENKKQYASEEEVVTKGAAKSVDLVMGKGRRVYDAPDKGILWAWEVSAYVWTKAIAAGAFLIPFLAWAFGFAEVAPTMLWTGLAIGLIFLGITGILLVMDLDKPSRFLNVLFRPQWGSWLVKGAYAITAYGGLLCFLAAANFFDWAFLIAPLMWTTAVVSVIVAIYTAFLFAQAKGRDFWQSPTLSFHMLVHSILAGAALFGILSVFLGGAENWLNYLQNILLVGLGVNLAIMLIELSTTHPTADAKRTVDMILKGRYKNQFWFGAVLVGNLIPFALLLTMGSVGFVLPLAAAVILFGIYITEHIWVEAPQRIPLS